MKVDSQGSSVAPAPGALGDFLRERLQTLLTSTSSIPLEGLHPALMRDVERTLIETVLLHVDGRRQDAARILGLHRNTLRLRMRALGLESPNARGARL